MRNFTRGAELRQDILATSDHLNWIVSSDVSREKFGCTCLLDASAHSFYHLWNAVLHLAESLVALRLISLMRSPPCRKALAANPTSANDRANDEATIRQRAAEHTSHIHDVARRFIEETFTSVPVEDSAVKWAAFARWS
jgi:hypothetical protein